MYKEIDLSVFPIERKEKLEKIFRYAYFEVLFYRSDLWKHSHRVLWLLEEIIPVAQKYISFDIEKARTLALVHDDAEMVTGDVQAIVKLRMTPEELEALGKQEEEAIMKLVQSYPKQINGYSYEELLMHAARKDCIEAQLVSYVDKLDAYCESLHEVYAGNISLLRSVTFYSNALPLFPYKFPALKDLLSNKDSVLTHITDQVSPFDIPASRFSHLNRPFDAESVKIDADFPFYNTWKKIVIEKGHIDWLVNQKEFLPK